MDHHLESSFVVADADAISGTGPIPKQSTARLLVDAEGLILQASPAAERMFFAEAGGLLGRHYGFSYHPGEATAIEILQPNG